MCKGVHRQLENIFAIGLRQTPDSEIIAFGQDVPDFCLGFSRQFQVQLIKSDFSIPQFVQLRG